MIGWAGESPSAPGAPEVFLPHADDNTDLKTTPLTDAHRARGGRMVEFAGYAMPVQYGLGVLKEHLWTREHAGAFDVSHMGPAFLRLAAPMGDADTDHRALAALIEPLVCGDIRGLKSGQLRYTLLMNEAGGVRDDLMIGRMADGGLYIVVNAGTKEADFDAIAGAAGDVARLERADDGGLIALQGPEAVALLAERLSGVADLGFMTFAPFVWGGAELLVSRSGYTGEDGVEILAPRTVAARLWGDLVADDRVQAIGLGARDSLRLEAGLPLYGHDLDETTSPVEANLGFAVSKRRIKALDFAGARRVADEMANSTVRVRVGLRVTGAPAREGAEILDGEGRAVGVVTSGGFAPSLSAPIAMGYIPPALAEPGTRLKVRVRDREQAADVVAMPFVAHRYHRKPKD